MTALAVALLLIGAGVVHSVVFLLDDQPWAGPVGWRKAITFGFSLGVTLLSLAVIARFVHLGKREGWWVLGTLAAASAFEYALIVAQAWRGEPSHFNVATVVDAVIWVAMGIGIAGIVIGTIAFTAAAFRPVAVAPALALGIRSGLVLLLAGYVVGGIIIGSGGGVSESPTGDESILGAAGELKVPHAIGLHALQVLPLLAWSAGRFVGSEPRQRRVVLVAAGAWAAVLVLQVLLAAAGHAPV